MKFHSLLIAIAGCASSHAAELAAIPFKTITGKDTSFGDYTGKVVLVVNTARR